MKKIKKFLFLIISVCFLSGCDEWENVYNEYKTVIDEGIFCTYKYSISENVDCGNKNNPLDCSASVATYIKLSAKSDGFYIDGEKVTANNVYLKNDQVYLTHFDYKSFLNDYKDSGECPNTISYGHTDTINVQYLYLFYKSASKSTADAMKHKYNLLKSLYDQPIGPQLPGKEPENNQNNESQESEFDASCLSPRAISCENYDSYDYWGNMIYIQLGRQKTVTNEIKEYFAVSYYKDFSGADVVYKGTYAADPNSLAASLAKNNEYPEQYIYVPSEEMSGVFPGENEYPASVYLNYFGGGNSPGDPYLYNLSVSKSTEENNQFEGSISSDQDEWDEQGDKIVLGTLTCDMLFKDEKGNLNLTHQMLSTTLRFMQYIGVIIALVLSIIDFVKVVPTNDKDGIQKAAKRAAMRLGIAILIFFVPIILDFILDLVGFNSSTCGLLN